MNLKLNLLLNNHELIYKYMTQKIYLLLNGELTSNEKDSSITYFHFYLSIYLDILLTKVG